MYSKKPLTDAQRIRMFERIDASGDCWLWTGPLLTQGYCVINGQSGARVVWEELVGPLGDLTIDHLCLVKHCLNPDHLEPVTRAENIRRAIPRRTKTGVFKKSHCVNGHEFTADNTYEFTNAKGRPSRFCLVCHNARQKRYRKAEADAGRRPSDRKATRKLANFLTPNP